MRPCTSPFIRRLLAAASLAALLTAPAARAAGQSTEITQAGAPERGGAETSVSQASSAAPSSVQVGQIGHAPDPCVVRAGEPRPPSCRQPEVPLSESKPASTPTNAYVDRLVAAPDAPIQGQPALEGVPEVVVVLPGR